MRRQGIWLLITLAYALAVTSCQAGASPGDLGGVGVPSATVQPTVGSQADLDGIGNTLVTPTPTAGPASALRVVKGTPTALATLVPAAAPVPGPKNSVSPMFSSPPFTGDHPLMNFFDHDLPFQWYDNNGFQLTSWGGKTSGVDGHSGHDWLMPVGTPLYAVADGEVVRAGVAEPFRCEPLDRIVTDSLGVILMHRGLEGRSVFTYYGHMSRVDVNVGGKLTSGDRIGLSGDTGCAIESPHLHFSVWVRWGKVPQTYVDPYGWEGEGPDPWLVDKRGGEKSHWLWDSGVAPRVYREVELSQKEISALKVPLVVRYIRWMGWRDEQDPNNEVVRIEVAPDSGVRGPVSLFGYTLSNGHGAEFVFPRGAQVSPDSPVWVYTGSGRSTDTVYFWDKDGGVWDDMTGCATLKDPEGDVAHQLGYVGAGSKTTAPCAAPAKGDAP